LDKSHLYAYFKAFIGDYRRILKFSELLNPDFYRLIDEYIMSSIDKYLVIG